MDLTKPQLIDIKLHGDDRGFVYCALDDMDKVGIKRTYVVENIAPGQVRAWHGHKKGKTFFHVINGVVKAAALPFGILENTHSEQSTYREKLRNAELATTVVTLSSRVPKLFYIPEGHYNGAVSLTEGTKILVYSTVSFEEVKEDDVRLSSTLLDGIWQVKHR